MHNFSRVYAYLRFSSDGQSDGLSFERQRELAYQWTRAQGLPDSAVEFIEDPGRSAYSGAHLSKGELGLLLKRLKETRREGNELLLFEAVDRSSRQGLFLFSSMIADFLKTGIFIHFLGEASPFSLSYPADSLLQLKLGIYASLAQQESARKSALSGNNWRSKRKRAREANDENAVVILTRECPRWLKVVNGKFVELPKQIEAIKGVFERARDGWGVTKIVRHANENKWAAPGKKGTWHNSLVNRLLENRALLGEYQPCVRINGKRVPEGDPILGYYPKVIDQELFYAVRGIRSTVSTFPNRRDKNNYNYLQGVAKCHCGGSWRRLNKNSGKQAGYALYGCSNRQRGVTACRNIPAKFFDHHFIAELCLNIPAFLAKIQAASTITSDSLRSYLGDVERRLLNLSESIERNGDPVGMLTSRMRQLADEKIEVLAKIEQASFSSNANPESFDAYQAATVYIPAFLNRYDDDPEGAEQAFTTRALFRARLLSAVSNVTVNQDRRIATVMLRSGEKLPLTLPSIDEIAGAAEYGVSAEEDLYPEEIAEDRRLADELARRFLN
ncbi:recombinase family protein [Burkholderia pseudomallei]|uniref:recombinase family protein n=1 Tax=Burkholderia pseudomallei TaxID=28450 RepID=UPI000E5BB96C|nr:recombinase family protein [Burkholderia pseudomallei]QGT03294.1 hypothetical protein D286_02160 [Burkholderia pseudomallei]